MKVLRIKDWADHFENNRTKELKRLQWVPMPNKHDGDSFCELMDHPNGTAHYGVWALIVQVASRCREVAHHCGGRGTLLRDDGSPYDFRSLARRTRGNPEIFEEAIKRLLRIGWLEEIVIEVAHNRADTTIPQGDAVPPRTSAEKSQDAASTRARAGASIPSIPSLPEGGAGGNELLSLAQVKAQVMTSAIPDDFVEFVYADWESRQGNDGGGVKVDIVPYVRKRWVREQAEYRAGTHKACRSRAPSSGPFTPKLTPEEMIRQAIQ